MMSKKFGFRLFRSLCFSKIWKTPLQHSVVLWQYYSWTIFVLSLQIVSVSVDMNFNDFSHFRQSYDNKLFDWQFVHFNDQYEWLDELHLLSLPEYILLSPDGKLYDRYPALPDKGAVMFFKQKFTPVEIEEDPLKRH